MSLSKDLVNDVIHYLTNDYYDWKILIRIIRLCHLNNPYKLKSKSYYEMWEEQCGINLPLMYICSIYLYLYAKKNNIDTFLFATRDCSQWHKIFRMMLI